MGESTPNLHVLIVYYSRFGAVGALASAIAEGVREVPGVESSLLEVEERPIEELRPGETEHEMQRRRARVVDQFVNVDAVIVGSPAYFGSMAAPVKRLFEDAATASVPPVTDRSRPWRHHLFRDKVGAAFTSSATPHGGNEMALHSMLTLMMHLGMLIVTPGQHEPVFSVGTSPYGATAVVAVHDAQTPSPDEQRDARELGRRVAEVTRWVVEGRLAWEQEEGRRRARDRSAAPGADQGPGATA